MKDKESKIIIADINNEQAGVVLCEAYKLEVFIEKIKIVKTS